MSAGAIRITARAVVRCRDATRHRVRASTASLSERLREASEIVQLLGLRFAQQTPHPEELLMMSQSIRVAASLCAMVLAVGGAVNARGHVDRSEAPTAASQRAPTTVKLLMWAKQPGTMTGARMRIAVDAKDRGVMSNLEEQMLL